MSQYAQIADFFRYGIRPEARGTLTDDDINGNLVKASAMMDSKFRGRYALPFIAWGAEVTMYCCWIAAYLLLSGPRGYNPQAGADINIEGRFEKASLWLHDVQRQAAHPDVTPQQSQSPGYDQPFVITSSVASVTSGKTMRSRGW